MLGFLQIIIYLLCVYLVYKGVEIFQIAFQSQAADKTRKLGLILGVLMSIGAVGIGIITVIVTELMSRGMIENLQNFPKLQ